MPHKERKSQLGVSENFMCIKDALCRTRHAFHSEGVSWRAFESTLNIRNDLQGAADVDLPPSNPDCPLLLN